MAKKIIRLSESQLNKIIKKVLQEQVSSTPTDVFGWVAKLMSCWNKNGQEKTIPPSCSSIMDKAQRFQPPSSEEITTCMQELQKLPSNFGKCMTENNTIKMF